LVQAAQGLLVAWVGLAVASAWWSSDSALSLGQGSLYGFMIAWALALAWTIEWREIVSLLTGFIVIVALGGALCIWYFYERNPNHRPGFPIGNPGTLSAVMLPAILMSLALIAAGLRRGFTAWGDGARRSALTAAIGHRAFIALVGLPPMLGCLWLAGSRGALLGLVVGLAALALTRAGRRARLVGIGLIVAGGIALGGHLYFSRYDPVMSRGATVRFRLYMWEYASGIWATRPITGVGAGAFPRLAGQMGIRDQALDPAAFMGDLPAHVHNELFEVFVEIGLVGGVTFVGGLLATLIAAGRLTRLGATIEERWLLTGAFAGMVAMLGEMMSGVSLHLPGPAPVFFTLVGVVWAAVRCRQPDSPDPARANVASRWPAHLRRGASVIAPLLIGGILAALAIRNWSGARHQFEALTALRNDRPVEAAVHAQIAQQRLLEPARVLFAQATAAQAVYLRAWQAFDHFATARSEFIAASQPSGPGADRTRLETMRQTAIDAAREAATAAIHLDRRAPTLLHMPALGARAAELLAQLHGDIDPAAAARWRQQAEQAWRLQRVYRPFDAEALLALTGYPGTLASHIGLLRDALRAEPPGPEWHQALSRLARQPGFEETLQRDFLLAAGPIDPKTDLNLLIASRAPEVYRLSAAYSAMRGDLRQAVRDSARAAQLCEPLRVRFPLLYPYALAEQADYLFRAAPLQPGDPIRLLEQAIEAIPIIQEQKYQELVEPFGRRLALYQLAAGDEQGALATLRSALPDDADASRTLADAYVDLAQMFLHDPTSSSAGAADWLSSALRLQPDHLRAWSWKAWLNARAGDVDALEATLGNAAAAGVPAEGLALIRRSLCQEYPDLCERIRSAPAP
jgi:O-antigen ligase